MAPRKAAKASAKGSVTTSTRGRPAKAKAPSTRGRSTTVRSARERPATTREAGGRSSTSRRSAKSSSVKGRSTKGRSTKGRIAPAKGRAASEEESPVSLSDRSQRSQASATASETASDSNLSSRHEVCANCGQEIPKNIRLSVRGEDRRSSRAGSAPPTPTKPKVLKTVVKLSSNRESTGSTKAPPKRGRGRPPKNAAKNTLKEIVIDRPSSGTKSRRSSRAISEPPSSAKPKILNKQKGREVINNSNRESTSSEKETEEAPKRGRGRPPKKATTTQVYQRPSSFVSVKASPSPAKTTPQTGSGVAPGSGKHPPNRKSQSQQPSDNQQTAPKRGRGRPPTIKANA
ncbi:hypothetical protein Mgra_00003309 [Meloidogyne graminicola]|uniref:Uncharacterized protein n=1 Tax=Meloidogyne graminicola TaxID=189291 RepID=A0A8S9ZVQ4_9BILA|nr:hypothetical protein Mgra_00003309 [Meloidogyne graminicola]